MRLNFCRILSHLEKQKLSTAVVDKTALSRAVEECTTQEAGEETKDILNLIRSDISCIQCCGSMTFWGGSGSGFADPCL
jgi:hypothetical protein